MTQEDTNDLIDRNMPQWQKDQIHCEETEQEIYESGQRSRDKKIAILKMQIDEAGEQPKETWNEFMDRAKRNGVSPTMQEEIDRQG